ncbi:MAG: PDZ domain-containing protein, partial [Solimonas sp.]
VILGLDGKPVENAKELSYRVATAQVGSSAIVEYQRGTERRETRIKLISAPETTARDETLMKGNTPFTGLIVANLSPAVADELGLPSGSTGVVASAIKGGPARRLFRKGDVILEVNGVVIDSVDTLNQAINKGDGFWQFAINRSGRVIRMQLGG